MSTHIYVDVDGVINAVAVSRPSWGWDDDAKVVEVEGFPIMYAQTLIDRLNALADRRDVQMHWLTTWEHDAPKSLCPALGINGQDWPVVGAEEHYSKELAGGWWKLAAIRDHLPAGTRAVWIDDDLSYDAEARDWLEDNPNVRGICPATHNGVTPKQMRLIEEWVA